MCLSICNVKETVSECINVDAHSAKIYDCIFCDVIWHLFYQEVLPGTSVYYAERSFHMVYLDCCTDASAILCSHKHQPLLYCHCRSTIFQNYHAPDTHLNAPNANYRMSQATSTSACHITKRCGLSLCRRVHIIRTLQRRRYSATTADHSCDRMVKVRILRHMESVCASIDKAKNK